MEISASKSGPYKSRVTFFRPDYADAAVRLKDAKLRIDGRTIEQEFDSQKDIVKVFV